MKILDMLFPQNVRCVFCGKESNNLGICDSCYEKIPFILGKTCKICGGRVNSGQVCIDCKGSNYSFEKVYCICEYKDAMRDVILKYKNGAKYISKPLAILVDKYFDNLKLSYDMIVPMPIHPNRRKQRGFNQSQLLLAELAKHNDKIREDVIIRSKDTPHQTGLNRENRKTNLHDAFTVIKKHEIKGKTIIVFDDIYTTGSSMQECAKTLKESGADKVFGVCLARTPLGKDFYLKDDNDDINYVEYIETHII